MGRQSRAKWARRAMRILAGKKRRSDYKVSRTGDRALSMGLAFLALSGLKRTTKRDWKGL